MDEEREAVRMCEGFLLCWEATRAVRNLRYVLQGLATEG